MIVNNEKSSHGIEIRFENFSIFTNNAKNVEKKMIVQPFSARIDGGSLFGILGGSGCGKSTLLNVMSGRYSKNAYKTEGHLLFSHHCKSLGYVTQSDFLMPNLTVRETLLFAAKISTPTEQLPNSCHADHSDQEELGISRVSHLAQHVESMIVELGLKECADYLIGDDQSTNGKRCLSGGQRRRVSVGVQILKNPQILYADEPTSGLDSFTAVALMEIFKKLTVSNNTTIVCTIHQPRSEILNMITSILVLSKGGYPVYFGSSTEIVEYFEEIGYPCPIHANPMDYYIDLTSFDSENTTSERKSNFLRVSKLRKYFRETNQELFSKLSVLESTSSQAEWNPSDLSNMNYQRNIFQQYILLVERFYRNNFRDGGDFIGGIIEAIILGCCVMGIYWQLNNTIEGVESRRGVLNTVLSSQCYVIMILSIERYCREIKIFDRELQDHFYHPCAYFFAHITGMIPQLISVPVIYSCIIYFGCNLRHDKISFLIFLAINIIASFILYGMIWTCLSVNRIFTFVQLLGNLLFTFFILTTGFLVNLDEMPIYVRWIQKISFLNYCYRILVSNELHDRTFDNEIEGNIILHRIGMKPDDYRSILWIYLILIGIVFYTIAAINLTFLRFPPTGSVAIIEKGKTFQNDDNEEFVAIDNENAFSPPRSKESRGNEKENEIENNSLELEMVDIYQDKAEDLPSMLESPFRSASKQPSKSLEIEIKLININLNATVKKNSTLNQVTLAKDAENSTEKSLLKNIFVTFQPGRLIALMGGSGSGKTTLLNLIANRIPHSCLKKNDSSSKHFLSQFSTFSVYNGSGDLFFNDLMPSSSLIRTSIGFVPQFDCLLPSLTVRETLQYQAKLRFSNLPSQKSSTEFIQNRVEEVIQLLGLSRCAHIQVGNEEKKGISGGEQKRLSIGIQLLNDPLICLFDEPTTGLDSFTAKHIVQTLKSLTLSDTKSVGSLVSSPSSYAMRESINSSPYPSSSFLRRRTVLMSIHQPRYDIFELIDEVTLLSRGELIWSGPVKEMFSHFEALGYPCPALVNPADFILDISSVDFRNRQLELSSLSTNKLLVRKFTEKISSKFSFAIKAEQREDLFQKSSGEKNDIDSPTDQNGILLMNSDEMDEEIGFIPTIPDEQNMYDDDDDNDNGNDDNHHDPVEPKTTRYPSSPSKYLPLPTFRSNSSPDGPSSQTAPITTTTTTTTMTSSLYSNLFVFFSSIFLIFRSNFQSFLILLSRSFLNLQRQPRLLTFRIIQVISYGLILCIFYSPMNQTNQQSTQNRIGLIYEILVLCFGGMINCIDIYSMERNVFYIEYMNGFYSSISFILAYFMISIPINMIAAFLFTILMIYVIQFIQFSMEGFFGCFFAVWSIIFVGECLGVIFCSIFNHKGFAINIVNATISMFCVIAGLLSLSMPTFLQGLSKISPMYWGSYLLMNFTFRSQSFSCDVVKNNNSPHHDDDFPHHCYSTGDEILTLYQMNSSHDADADDGLSLRFILLGVIVSVYLFLAILSVRIRAFLISH